VKLENYDLDLLPKYEIRCLTDFKGIDNPPKKDDDKMYPILIYSIGLKNEKPKITI
jgi:hypothetical protein